jgi:hypothetical protein
LGFRKSGVAQLQIQVLYAPTPAETRYKKHRNYAAVPGPIGNYDSFDVAIANTGRLLGSPLPANVASVPLPSTLKFTSLPVNNAKAINAAGRNATMAAIASAAGSPGQATAMSAGAVLMNSIPPKLLPAGLLTGASPAPAIQKAVIKAAAADKVRKPTPVLAKRS